MARLSSHLSRALVAAALLFGLTAPASAQTSGNWITSPGGTYNWTDGFNWDSGTPPNGGGTATLTNDITGDQTINLGTAITLASLAIGDSTQTGGVYNAFTIVPSGGSLAFNTGATITSQNGANTISSGIALGGPTTISHTTASGSLTLSGAITGTGPLTIGGAGTVVIPFSNNVNDVQNTFTGGITVSTGATLSILNNSSLTGTNFALSITASGNSPVGNGSVITLDGGTVRLDSTSPTNNATRVNTNRNLAFTTNGGEFYFHATLANAGPAISVTGGAIAPAIIKADEVRADVTSDTSGYFDSTLAVQTKAITLTGSGTAPLQFITQPALINFNAASVAPAGVPVTITGVSGGSATVGDFGEAGSMTTGRIGLGGSIATYNIVAGVTFQNAVQVASFNTNDSILDGNITLAAGSQVDFSGRANGGAGRIIIGNVSGTGNNASGNEVFHISSGATGILDFRVRTDSSTIGNGTAGTPAPTVTVNSTTQIDPSGTLLIRKSNTASTGINAAIQVNGPIVGAGTDAAGEAQVTLDSTVSGFAIGTGVTSVNFGAGATLAVNGSGNSGLQFGATSAQLAAILTQSRINGLTGTGGTFTYAPSDNNGLNVSFAPSSPSAVKLGIGSAGSSPVTVTLGTTANDLANWAGLVVKGSSVSGGSTVANLAVNETFPVVRMVGGSAASTLNAPSGTTLTAGLLTGSGSVTGNVTIAGTAPAASITPNATVGTIAYNAGAMSWQPGGTFQFEYNSTTPDNTSFTTHNAYVGSGSLDLSTLTPASFTINIASLGNAGTAGSSPVSYTIASLSGGVTGASGNISNLFTFTGTGYTTQPVVMANNPANTATLTFTPVPEPTAVLAACGAAAGLLTWVRRRKARTA